MSDTPQAGTPKTELTLGSVAPDEVQYAGRAGLVSFSLKKILPHNMLRLAAGAAVALGVAVTTHAASPNRDGLCCDDLVSRSEARVTTWPSKVRVGFGLLRQVDSGLVREFEKAWRYSKGGTHNRECVVLVFLKTSGVYEGKLQGFTNEWKQSSFKWSPSAVAIVHTHPNISNPEPSPDDEDLAQRLGVPIFTITSRGMYGYDPATDRTVRVLANLDWLDLSSWTPDVYERSLEALVSRLKGSRARRFADSK